MISVLINQIRIRDVRKVRDDLLQMRLNLKKVDLLQMRLNLNSRFYPSTPHVGITDDTPHVGITDDTPHVGITDMKNPAR